MEQNTTFKMLHFLMMAFIVINLFILDIKLFSPQTYLPTSIGLPSPTPYSDTNYQKLAAQSPQQTQNACPVSCTNLIYQATQSATPNIGSPIVPTTENRALKTLTTSYIPFGWGSTTNSNWSDLTGTETIIDASSYGTITETQLTYALRNPTQNGKVGVRLYNVTDGYVVYGSETEMEGSISKTVNTLPFALPQGKKLYRIQLRSTLSFDAYLDGAKLKIVSE